MRSARFAKDVRAIEVNIDIEEKMANFTKAANGINDSRLCEFFDNGVRHSQSNSTGKYTSAMTNSNSYAANLTTNVDSNWRQRSSLKID